MWTCPNCKTEYDSGSDELWKQVKAGNRPEFSIGGAGRRVDV